ncbi:hybrid sensor histidine kinase/response regulator [Cupriavidus pauculus]|nr:ATP-binding protein [Cupriavidus pauculus]
MSATPLPPSHSEIHLLRHHQRWLLVAGGGLLTLALAVAMGIAIWTDIRDYIGEGRTAYSASKAMLVQEMHRRQAAMHSNVVRAELVWAATDQTRRTDDFKQGLLLSRRDPALVEQLVLGVVSPTQPADRFARYLAFSERLAYTMTANAREYGMPFAGYFINPQHSFVSMAWPQSGWAQSGLPSTAPARAGDIVAVMRRLSVDMQGLHRRAAEARSRGDRPIVWDGPFDDLLSGQRAVKLVAPAFDRGQMFGIFVSSVPVAQIAGWLHAGSHDGSFMVFDASGGLLGSAAGRHGVDAGLPTRVWMSGVWKERLESSDYVFRDGVFSISESLPNTDWSVVYAFSWKTILLARAGFLASHIAGAALLLALLWILIFAYLRNVMNPLLLRSQEVFDREALNRTIVDAAPSGLCLISKESGQVLLGNRALAVYACKDRPIERKLLDLGGGASCERQSDAGRVGQAQELTVTTVTGEVRHLLVNAVHTRFLSEAALLCSVTDITEHKQLEESLVQARRTAEMASRATSTFLATMSHEIRTPLNGMLGNLELLGHSSLDALQRDRLATIDRSSRVLLELVGDILDYSKIAAGQLQLERVRFDLIELLEETLSMLLPAAREKALKVDYEIGRHVARHYIGDPVRVRQILANLLSNAVKFTEAGHVMVGLRVDSPHPSGLPVVVLNVSDTGIGIPASLQTKLFHPFEQGDPSMTRRYGGTGLGLALCHRLCQAMGGSIELESQPDHGTSIVVSLPLDVAGDGELVERLPSIDIGIACEDPLWRAHLQGHINSWGPICRALPAMQAAHAHGPALMVIDRGSLNISEAESSPEHPTSRILLLDNGPREPLVQGGDILVSRYALAGLYQAIRLAQASTTQLEAPDVSRAPDIPAALRRFDAPSNPEDIRVLVVEDHPVNRVLLGNQLEMLGVTPVLAADAREALQYFAQGAFDVMLTDLSMPDIDGYMLAKMLRAQGATLPIIAVTAHASREHTAQCKDVGIDDVLVKPVALQLLARAIERCTGGQSKALRRRPTSDGQDTSGRVLPLLKATTEASLSKLRSSSLPRDLERVLSELHSIKGAFAMQGQEDVVRACQDLENACRARTMVGFDQRIAALQSLVANAMERLRQQSHENPSCC